MGPTGDASTRSYHHGDLRPALLRAGYELAREGGPAAVTLRAATRRAGVTATAAYRHFASHDDLLRAVGARALGDLARSMEEYQARVVATDPAERAHERLVAVGDGYLALALDEPGVFGTAMFGLRTLADARDPDSAGGSGRTPFELLTDAIADLTTHGRIDAGRTQEIAVTCWSTVHGFADLATRGPFRTLPRADRDAIGRRLVRDLVDGLPVPSGGGGPS
ncbi:MAG: TetR/AcrR family transcriptional regulator [Propionicimonas sp.]|uniref:TetR/AcrR family transcriptional regulator n=1 Tax=Propionicimonas sp. TaxID=1955623 RepID=UPI003D10722C